MTIELDPIASGYSTTKINANFIKVEAEFNTNVLRRNGLAVGEANQMAVPLDMNSNDILNVNNLDVQGFSIQNQSINGFVQIATEAATAASLSEANAGVSETNAAASAVRAEAAAILTEGTNLAIIGTGDSRTITSSTGADALIPVATQTVAGFSSIGDKIKLDGIAAGAQVNVATNLSTSSTSTSVTVASSTGTSAVLPVATIIFAGVMSAADKLKIDTDPISKQYVSPDQTIVAAGLVTLSHGLAVVPKLVMVSLVCQTAEFGYLVGDVVPVPPNSNSSANSDGFGPAIRLTSSQIIVRYGSTAAVFIILSATTGSIVSITPANWRLRIGAYA
jgi:hypothetical protein